MPAAFVRVDADTVGSIARSLVAGGAPSEAECDFLAQAKDPVSAEAVRAEFESYRINAPVDPSAEDLAGVLGLFRFFSIAERAAPYQCFETALAATLRREASDLLTIPKVRDHLYQLYDVPPEYCAASVLLHAVGTTSVILKAEYDIGFRALKLVKPWHFDDEEIRQKTDQYRAFYGRLSKSIPGEQVAPHVYVSKPHYVVMEFIDGV